MKTKISDLGSPKTPQLSPEIGRPSKIFYDGNCIICDIEISHYKRLAPLEFELVDISRESFHAATFNLSLQAVESDMHVLTPDGELKIGVAAFIHIWSRIPRYRLLKAIVQTPIIYEFAKVGYLLFKHIRPYLPKKV